MLAILTILAAGLGGCADLAYYRQAVGGHLTLLQAARPIPELLADPATEPELRARLLQSQAIRTFAVSQLLLPDNGSYLRYANLGRPYVVWNVFAAPEFSLPLKKWCFVFVGCVTYRGYYRQADAERFAATLQASGLDTYVVGVPAYSTLGFFPDPLLNTFLGRSESEVARLLFHELAHQLLYVKGDPAFNESFASAVADAGLHRWRVSHDPVAEARLAERKQGRSAFDQRLAAHRRQLQALYASAASDDEKRRHKREIMAELALAAAPLFRHQQPASPVPPFNNAVLGSFTLYRCWLPAFEALLRAGNGDLPAFYQRAAALARLPPATRRASLGQWMDGDLTCGTDPRED